MNIKDNLISSYYHRRFEYLASLCLKIPGKIVLEVLAVISDQIFLFLDKNCIVKSTNGRQELLKILSERFADVKTVHWNAEDIILESLPKSDIVYAYGLLYHTAKPLVVLKNLGLLTNEYLLLETCVSYGDDESINLINERIDDPTQALTGIGCRPTRLWIFNALKQIFPYVYLTKTQPAHEEFPIDWETKSNFNKDILTRSVFIAAHKEIKSSKLSNSLLNFQVRE